MGSRISGTFSPQLGKSSAHSSDRLQRAFFGLMNSGMHDHYPGSAAYLELQPLRIPSGWTIGWNSLYASSRAEKGEFGGSSIFNATNAGSRFNIDVAFEPEFDPEGEFRLVVLYQPWPRTPSGRRKRNLPFRFDGDAETVHSFATRSFERLIAELEHWIARCSAWVREEN